MELPRRASGALLREVPAHTYSYKRPSSSSGGDATVFYSSPGLAPSAGTFIAPGLLEVDAAATHAPYGAAPPIAAGRGDATAEGLAEAVAENVLMQQRLTDQIMLQQQRAESRRLYPQQGGSHGATPTNTFRRADAMSPAQVANAQMAVLAMGLAADAPRSQRNAISLDQIYAGDASTDFDRSELLASSGLAAAMEAVTSSVEAVTSRVSAAPPASQVASGFEQNNSPAAASVLNGDSQLRQMPPSIATVLGKRYQVPSPLLLAALPSDAKRD